MDELEGQLHQLIKEACKAMPGSSDRQKKLTKIIRLIQNSGKIWRDSSPYYEDALQQTWLHLCRNFHVFDPERGNVTTWLNVHLQWRLKDYWSQEQQQKAWIQNGEMIDVPAQAEPPPILPTVKQWVEANDELRRIHIHGHPEVNCQVLILRRLPPETNWKTLAREFNISVSTLSSFYQRKCLPLLRKFGESQGYL